MFCSLMRGKMFTCKAEVDYLFLNGFYFLFIDERKRERENNLLFH